ncbi:hypothetical protein O1611_g10085 [Lasiodiplodia mahajangana]|uniref:Uncharacterized protein n=1 Tax=Lasiodiplodia mahajangana TaxID=1108764 RepID=A0ACC2J260_9PEZI|nr:hypothetical protein O1611_g10085 [Lasiodiplodia mahajangana]
MRFNLGGSSSTNSIGGERGGKSTSSWSTSDLPETSRGPRAMAASEPYAIPPRQTSSVPSLPAQVGHQVQQQEADEDDEYGDAPITMMDNDDLDDGELTMVEPLSIDDEPLKRAS